MELLKEIANKCLIELILSNVTKSYFMEDTVAFFLKIDVIRHMSYICTFEIAVVTWNHDRIA